MSALTTLPALLALLENTRFVFSQCPGTPSAVSIPGNSIAANAYNGCTTITSLVIASTVTSIGLIVVVVFIVYYYYN